ncbi:MAG TPA: CBS domain-containing protein [Polyangiaceae bacterium]|nr:CBS domain-containing protein [Polyangiaceae bacterium]HMR74572.1 CBS domain-containing protein [Polyangiaceae bacterium]
MVVEEIMTKDPTTVDAAAAIRDVISVLFELDVRHLPVVDGKTLVGIISDRDVRAFLAPTIVELENPEEIAQRLLQPIGSVMSSDVLSVDAEMELSDLVDLMLDHKVGAVPVVDPESDELVGIVSYVDVLRAAQDKL